MERLPRMREFTPKDLRDNAKSLRKQAADIEAAAETMDQRKMRRLPVDGASRGVRGQNLIQQFIASVKGCLERESVIAGRS
jgi:hypothetical protein